MTDITTFGHGPATEDEMVDLLHGAHVHNLVDVRSFPGSWKHEAARQENMVKWVPAHGMKYTWIKDLGGYRKAPDGPELDTGWRNQSFANYAAYARTPPFASGLLRLMIMARKNPTCYMCSESVWWRCHRRIISDYLVLVHHWDVHHLMHDGRLEDHIVTPMARVDGEQIIYDKPGGEATKQVKGTTGTTI